MDLRAMTGYVAHALLVTYWVWVVSRTAPQLRKGSRDTRLRLRIFLIKSAAIGLSAVVVGVIHFWATQWWHVVAALLGAVVFGRLLNRAYRRVVAAPRHRLTLAQRAHKFERRLRAVQTPP